MKTRSHVRNFTFLTLGLLVNLLPFSSFSQCPTAPADQTITCGSSTTLNAQTGYVNYQVVTTSCSAIPISGATAFPTACDDCITGQIPIGFPFNFFGNVYNDVVIQSNGILGFGPFTYVGYNSFAIPSGGNPNNYIAGFYADIDIRYGGTITYQSIGVAPNRQFIASYDNCVPYNVGSGAGTGTVSFQIILNEDGSFYTQISQLSANWWASTSLALATQGAENDIGTLAFPVPGRNATDWPAIVSTDLDCHLFNPVPCIFQEWEVGGTTVSTNASYTVSPNVTTDYVAVWDCSNGLICRDTTTISIAGPTMSQGTLVNNSSCTSPDGSIQLNFSNLAAGTYTLNYLANGTPTSTSVTLGGATTIAQGATFNSGSLDVSDGTWIRNTSGSTCNGSAGTSYYYDVYSFQVSASGSYTFVGCFPTIDGHASLYQNAFNPANPCGTPSDFIIANDDTGASCGADDPQLVATLTTGVTYYIVSTSFYSTTTGAYSWTFTGPAGATISGAGSPSATITGLVAGDYSNFTIGSGCNSAALAGPISLTGPSTPATTGVTICPGGSGNLTSSASCTTMTGTTINQSTTFNTGSLAASDPTWNRTNSGTTCGLSGVGTSCYHDVFTFQVTTSGSYTFNMCTSGTNWDGFGALYQNNFNAASPCGVSANFVSADDDGNAGGQCNNDARIIVTLAPGITYYLVTTSFANSVTGNYQWVYTGPAGATIFYNLTPAPVQWYTTATGGTSIGSGASFNPVGVAGSGLPNTNTSGTYSFYAACPETPNCRTQTDFVINTASTAPTSVSGGGTLCQGIASNLSIVGGSLGNGSTWEWFEGSCGGTSVGTGASYYANPTTTTTYYVRASAGDCPATTCQSATITMPNAGTTLANNNESATCIVNQNGYVHFYHSSGRLLASINSYGQDLGNVDVTAYAGSPVDVPACGYPYYETATMGRHWVITPTNQPTNLVDVVLHFDQGEFNSLITASTGNPSPDDDVALISDLKLSKYSGPNNVDGNPSNNCASAGGNGGTTIHSQIANGNSSSLRPGFNSNGRYVRFNISSFSEFWLHGQNINSPLATELFSFSANCETENTVKVNWSTLSESNCVNYTVSKSTGNDDWQSVQTVNCSAPSSIQRDYQVIDENRYQGVSYYRLEELDNNGIVHVLQTLSVSCSENELQMIVYPNPAQNNFNVQINSATPKDNVELTVTDMSGKKIISNTFDLKKGSTVLPFESEQLSAGTYLIFVNNIDQQLKPLKLIIQK